MAVTQNSFVGDGSTRNFTFTFPYLDASHVKAKIDGLQTTAFTLTGASTLTFSTAPASGAVIVIYRETPSQSLLVDYTAGTALRESDLETSLKQILYVSQETQTLAEQQTNGGLQAQIDTVNSLAQTSLLIAGSAANTANTALATSGGYLNKIINGEFSIVDRANGVSTTGWIFDRWRAEIATSLATFTRTVAFNNDPTESGLPTDVRRYVRVQVQSTISSGSYVRMRQSIENVRTFADQTVNVSFWARATSATQIAVNLTQKFGTGGSPSAAVEIAGNKFNVGTSWQRFNGTFTIPSVAGKTLGSDGNTSLDLNVWFEAGSNFNTQTNTLGQGNRTVDITRIMVVPGSSVKDWEDRTPGEERLFCQRFWEKISVFYGGYLPNGTTAYETVPFKITKRATPSISIVAPSSNGLDSTNPISTVTSPESILIAFAKNATSGSYYYSATINADAELP